MCRGEADYIEPELLNLTHKLGLLPRQGGDIPRPESYLLHPGIGVPRPPPSTAAQHTMHPTPMAPPLGGVSLQEGGPTSLLRDVTAGPRGKRHGHQALANEPHPRAWLRRRPR